MGLRWFSFHVLPPAAWSLPPEAACRLHLPGVVASYYLVDIYDKITAAKVTLRRNGYTFIISPLYFQSTRLSLSQPKVLR